MRGALTVRRTAMAGVLAALAVVAACDDDDDPIGPNRDIIESIQNDPEILAAVHESNVGEIMAGQEALTKAEDGQVLAFAQMMITDHTALDAQGTTLATELAITPALPDQRLPQLQAQEMQRLDATAAGAAFDRVYIDQQITAHERTLELVDAGIDRTNRLEIRTLLEQARPTIVEHLELARDIQIDVGFP